MKMRRLLSTISCMLGVLILSLLSAHPALADYTPSDPWYAYGVGSGGAKVSDNTTVIDESDAAAAWNTWTNFNKLTLGSNGCGSTTSCIIYANDGTTVLGCPVPEVDAPWWAEAHILAGSYRSIADSNCNLGSTTYPIFIVSIDDEGSWSSDDKKLHVARHEMGHALLLGDTSASCWSEWGYLLPIMHDTSDNCSSYPQNYSATYNEALYAVIRNDW